MGKLKVMNQGNFHLVDNGLKFTMNLELGHLPKSTLPLVNQFVGFISSRSFVTYTNPKSWQNFRSITLLHVYLASL